MQKMYLALTTVLALTSLACAGDDAARKNPKDAGWLLPLPEVNADPKIPTLKDVVGHGWGTDVSSHAEIERYVKALAEAAPTRCRLETYGKTAEGRALYNLMISSTENMRRLDEIRRDNLRLADPRQTTAEQTEAIVRAAPAVVWLAYCVHGNETSPSDAALVTAYHLLADRRPETRALLDKLVVIIDPLQNPDGRERFIQFHREGRGAFVQSEPLASDRAERWPGGRFNHYLFDMNRDWSLQTQAESKARVAAYLRWQPQIFVDAHEMGPNSNFFFDPPADPVSPFVMPRQREWYMRVGRHHAGRFDQYGFAYTTREMFDAFGPQYGSTWPTLQGAIGILWEQAGVRGKAVDRQDETRLHYHQAVRHHYVGGVATLEAAAEARLMLLRDFYQNRADSIKLGLDGPVRHFFLLEEDRPARAAELARLLLRNGIEVRRVTTALHAKAADQTDAKSNSGKSNDGKTDGGKTEEFAIPAGSYHVPLAQPAARLIRTLLDRHQDMGEKFRQRQLDRLAQGQRDEIYDITAWSLPLAHGARCLACENDVSVASEPVTEARLEGTVVGGSAKVAYLVPPEDDGVPRALCAWLQAGLRVHVADQSLKIAGVAFAKGTLVLKVHDNAETLHAAVQQAARDHGLKIHAVHTGFVDEGAGLGGPNVKWVKPASVLLVVDRPASYSVGHTWYLLDQVWRYPVTRIAGRSLGAVDLRKYNVVILPDGSYGLDGDAPSDSTLTRVKDWVRQGGTLILVKGAVSWAMSDKVKLLATKAERKPPRGDEVKPAKADGKSGETKSGDAKSDEGKSGPAGSPTLSGSPAGPPPDRVPGAFFRASVHDDHWVTFGVPKDISILFNGSLIVAPLKQADGRNLVTFAPRDQILTSGFCWPDTLKLQAGKPFAVYQSLGAGHVIGFTDDPNFRAMCPQTQRLFVNAMLLGPGH